MGIESDLLSHLRLTYGLKHPGSRRGTSLRGGVPGAWSLVVPSPPAGAYDRRDLQITPVCGATTDGCSRILYKEGRSLRRSPPETPSQGALFLGTSTHVAVHHRALRKVRSTGGSVTARTLCSPSIRSSRLRHGRERAIRKDRRCPPARGAGASDAEGMALLATARLTAFRARTWTEAKAPHGRGSRARSKDVLARQFVLQKSIVQSRLREAPANRSSGSPGSNARSAWAGASGEWNRNASVIRYDRGRASRLRKGD